MKNVHIHEVFLLKIVLSIKHMRFNLFSVSLDCIILVIEVSYAQIIYRVLVNYTDLNFFVTNFYNQSVKLSS